MRRTITRRGLVGVAAAGLLVGGKSARAVTPLRTPGRVGLARASVPPSGTALTPQAARADREKTVLHRQVDATDREIDGLVYNLYGLNDEEIKIVEEA